MEQLTHFRTAFNGFNREDVVRYLEFINNKHAAEVAKLNNELDYLRTKQQQTQDTCRLEALEQQVAALTDENQSLLQQLAQLELTKQEPAEPKATAATVEELEAYRRAERVERTARERAKQISDRTAAVLSDAGSRVDGAAQRISEISNQILEQLNLLKEAMTDSHEAFEDASRVVEDLYAQGE